MTKTTAIPTFAQHLATIAALAEAERPLSRAHTRDAILADHHKVQHLIFETPSASLTAARVKASTLEQHARFDLQGHEVPLAEIVTALRAAGAR